MPKWLVGFTVGALVLVCFWLIWARGGVNFANQQLLWQGGDPAAAGQWGDTFGAFNALFGALGFAAVLATLWAQSIALAEQRADLHRQRFESTYFELLKMLREARDEVRFLHTNTYLQNAPSSNITHEEHAAFRAAYREIRFWVRRDLEVQPLSAVNLAQIYSRRVHSRYESTFGAYFRLLYSMLDRVANEKQLSEFEKNNLGNLVRGQLTSFEAILCGCNGLADFSKDFDRFVIRFRLLKYARRGMVFDELHRHYPAAAFEGRDDIVHPEADDDVEGDVVEKVM